MWKTKDAQIIQQDKILLGGQNINLRARQLVYILASLMDKDNPTDMITVDANDFLDFINNTPGKKWSDIYQLTTEIFDHLNDNYILIKKPRSKDFSKINWLSSLRVEGGLLKARFSADITDYFLYKKNLPYTKLLWDLRPYKSRHTARIMDLFQKYHNKISDIKEFCFEYDLEDLKFFFGVHEKYKRVRDFKHRVIDPAKKELEENKSIPYYFEYDQIKQGRNIKAIKFTVYVREEILLGLVPELKIQNKNQLNIFDTQDIEKFSEAKVKIFHELLKFEGIGKVYAQRVLSNLSDSQALGYLYLCRYNVNQSLSFTLVNEHCSFGELRGNEHIYIKFTLDRIESERQKKNS